MRDGGVRGWEGKGGGSHLKHILKCLSCPADKSLSLALFLSLPPPPPRPQVSPTSFEGVKERSEYFPLEGEGGKEEKGRKEGEDRKDGREEETVRGAGRMDSFVLP
jgi:hypothetical protein